MLTLGLVLLALAAAAGATMLVLHFRRMPLPMPLALAHGTLAGVGLEILIIAVANAPAPGWSTGISLPGFELAAFGGFALFTYHLRHVRHPSALVIGHGAVAVASLAVLATAFMR